MQRLAIFLTLSRFGQLPTIWSNCLAGWLLAGGTYPRDLLKGLAGVSFLYLGGSFLKDAFDVEHDRDNRAYRPIPSGAVSEQQVWRWGLYLLAAGGLLLFTNGLASGVVGLSLVFCIVLHNTVYRLPGIAPGLIGLCRFLAYCIGASAADWRIPGDALWWGLASGAFAAGAAYASRQSVEKGIDKYWPVLLLGFPLLLAYLVNSSIYNPYREPAIWIGVLVCLWMARSLRELWSVTRDKEKATLSLIATLVFIDWLALVHIPRALGLCFLGLFVLTLALNKLEAWANKSRQTQTARNFAQSSLIGT